MRRSFTLPLAAATGAVATAALAVVAVGSGANGTTQPAQQARLVQRAVLPAATFRDGSPATGAFFTDANRTTAAGNGVSGPTTVGVPYFSTQPVQGISAMVPAGDGTWWALPDNGYGTRDTSADWQLAIYRIDPRWGDTRGPQVLSTLLLSDPSHRVPWKIVCDQTGADLPPFTFNALPATPPAACGPTASARQLTGFDFDPESMEVGPDGTFWIGEEFGPFLLHADRQGRLLDAPFAAPGMTSPQNPTLRFTTSPQLAMIDTPTIAASRGFENMAISPDRRFLYPMPEGPVAGDDPQDLRMLTFDVQAKRFTGQVRKVRLEMPGGVVNLTSLKLTDQTFAYPGVPAPAVSGGESAAETTAIDSQHFLLLERDGAGDAATPAPRFKKVMELDASGVGQGGYLAKSVVVDLMAIPDPAKVGGDGDFFRFPFNTIESVHVVDDHTILVANDNNYPFSNGRARSATNERTGPLAPDDNEMILVRLGQSLHVDSRLLHPPR